MTRHWYYQIICLRWQVFTKCWYQSMYTASYPRIL